MRDLATPPKAHLHLHFTGSMRVQTLADLAAERDVRLPRALLDGDPLQLPPPDVAAAAAGWDELRATGTALGGIAVSGFEGAVSGATRVGDGLSDAWDTVFE